MKGYSLLELLIVVVIIGILVAVAIPQYAQFRGRANRSHAMTLLATLANAEEAYFAQNAVYIGTGASGFFNADGSATMTSAIVNSSFASSYSFFRVPNASGKTVAQHLGVDTGVSAAELQKSSYAFGVVVCINCGANGDVSNFLIGATSNFDGDATLDTIAIDSKAAGQLIVDDIAR